MLVLLYIPFTLSVLSIQCYSTAAHVADARRDLSSSSAGAISDSTEELQCAVEAVSYDNDDSAGRSLGMNSVASRSVFLWTHSISEEVLGIFAATRALITRFLPRALITRAASEETLITRAVYEWANAVRGNMISEIVYDFRSEPSIQEGSGSAPNSSKLIVRKTPNELKWPFFHSGSKQETAVSPDVLLMRSHGEDVVNCTLDLLQPNLSVVWIGIPGVVSNICEWCQQTRCYLFGLLFFTH
jgi:hypothetical protein